MNIAKVWTFPSSSDPDKTYETLLYVAGTTSCNCPGWTRRRNPDGTRSCRHTRLVDQGRADRECVASHDYTGTLNPLPQYAATSPAGLAQLRTTATQMGQRKFAA